MNPLLSGGDGLRNLHQCWSDCGKNVHLVKMLNEFDFLKINHLKVTLTTNNDKQARNLPHQPGK